MPPLALISSAAICAPPGVAAPAIACTSAITPILIGGPSAKAGSARQVARAVATRLGTARFGTIGMRFSRDGLVSCSRLNAAPNAAYARRARLGKARVLKLRYAGRG